MMDADDFYGTWVARIGLLFLDAPYRAGMLEKSGREKLTVDLAVFDCMTFVETVLALAACAYSERLTYPQLQKNVRRIRYRDGKMDGYSTRLHYFTDWLRNNEKKKVLKDKTRGLGGDKIRKKIDFMTAHRDHYAALKSEKEFKKMRQIELRLSRKTFFVIQKDFVGALKTKVQNGDLVAFTTDEEGLDVAHVGFAVRQGKSLRLLHASIREKAVVVSTQTLPAYLKSRRKFTGVIIARPLIVAA
ncbi:MAG: DUF1460 domain-containing protein [Smithellaceae bacterium]